MAAQRQRARRAVLWMDNRQIRKGESFRGYAVKFPAATTVREEPSSFQPARPHGREKFISAVATAWAAIAVG